MGAYNKKVLSLADQLQTYIDAELEFDSQDEVCVALETIGYYRLRGYSFHFYNNATKKYYPGTTFSQIIALYNFDQELSSLVSDILSKVEVATRARLSEALLVHHDPLILTVPDIFMDKTNFWKNLSTMSSEIARAKEVFIQHHFDMHEGYIPTWAAVEVMSFGTLSKMIKNLKTGVGSSFSAFAAYYSYKTLKGNTAVPSKENLSSWIHAAVILRNTCAHNGRLYNRTFSKKPALLQSDRQQPQATYTGLYQMLLAVKYIRPTDEVWNEFLKNLEALFTKYDTKFEFNRLNFPADWKNHFQV